MVWAEMVMGRNGHGPKWLWAEMTSDQQSASATWTGITTYRNDGVWSFRDKIQDTRSFILSIYLSLLSRSFSDHHLRCGGWLNLEFSKREKHSLHMTAVLYSLGGCSV